jgi:para-nitrobenzyl esterase
MTTIETASGRIEGIAEGGLAAFRGVPYAQPPVGDLRLRAPRPVEPWIGTRSAREFGHWAPQNRPSSPLLGEPPGPQHEDCLTLNIWAPASAVGAGRPVLVWSHGGGFLFGSGATPLYNGGRLAARGDAVVVTLNYRLGILGFLAHPDLADEGARGACGNWGLLDHIAALTWIRDNIAAFGGDPGNVTIFGESAGGMAVADLLAAPAARGLFHKAIVQSGPPIAESMDEAGKTAARVMADVGVSRAADLREVSVETLLATQASILAQRGSRGLPFVPVVDGVTLPDSPDRAIARGSAAEIPLMIGTNRDEAKVFMLAYLKDQAVDESLLARRVEETFAASDVGLDAEHVIETYRSVRARRRQPVDAWELLAAIETDRMFRAESLRTAEAQACQQRQTFNYLFTWESAALGGKLGACHALEIPFVFGALSAPRMDAFAGAGPVAERLSETMMDAWLAFARTGDPSTTDLGEWPAYDPQRRATMMLGADCHVESAPFDEERRLWEKDAAARSVAVTAS